MMEQHTANLADLFQLREGVVFLNHGSFGACPRRVFDVYQHWQRELELQPVEFVQRRLKDLIVDARKDLADFVGAEPENLVYVTNATIGLNIVARSIDLAPGDEVLSTDHEYGSLNNTWDLVCGQRGATYINRPVSLPIESTEQVVEAIWSGVTERTKVLFCSHITSPTALIFPIEELIRRARERGIVTVIDGAHAPGQVSLNLSELGADYYVGNCHKWMMTPKGSGFLYARGDLHHQLVPLVGGRARKSEGTSLLASEHQYQGTRDMSAFLSVPEAIRFMEDYNWPEVRERCHQLLRYARGRFAEYTGLTQPVPDSPAWFSQMTIVPLPECDGAALKRHLYETHSIEIPITGHDGQRFLRISLQGYNDRSHVDLLYDAVVSFLRR